MRPVFLNNQFFLGALPSLPNLVLKTSIETPFAKISDRVESARANFSSFRVAYAVSNNICLKQRNLLPIPKLTPTTFRRMLECTRLTTPSNEKSNLLSQEAK